ncbi:hypothetical protein BC940DRAFT_337793 [Gongronella butleri]|nr:hypothetical protein BC940DRAFT_337793 [Gongronella butleri]
MSIALSEDQRATLLCLMDTFLQPLDAKDTEKLVQRLARYPTVRPNDIREILAPASCTSLAHGQWHPIDDGLLPTLARAASPDKVKSLTLLLSLLGTASGMAILTQARWFTPFRQLAPRDRVRVLRQWQHSRFHTLRMVYMTFAALTWQQSYATAHAAQLHRVIGYPGTDPVRTQPDYVPRFQRPRLPITRDIPQNIDVIVIGSGAGGGVVAAKLAKAGKKVMVIEKGPYYHESDFILRESEWRRNFEGDMSILNEEGTMNFVAGSLIGGGTSINYSASLRLPHWARDEWAKQGLPYFASEKFTKDLDTVCDRIGVTTEGIRLTGSNKVLKEGCEKLGYHVQLIPQNSGGEPHECHWCMGGCADGVKNGSMNTWLRDAVEHGALIRDRTTVTKVLIENGRAVGVAIFDHSTKTAHEIKAPRVIVSAGTLHSPGILRRSGLKNQQIGKNLRIHPCIATVGIFPEVQDVYKGTMMTTYTDAVSNWDGDHYGAKVEGMSYHAGMGATMNPWHGPLDHKATMAKYRYTVPLLTVSRDKDSAGSVFYEGDGDLNGPVLHPDKGYRVRINYQMSKHDMHSVVLGIVASCNILVAAGAREVRTMQNNVPPFEFSDDEQIYVDNPRFKAWLDMVERAGPPTISSTPHQMGTCRMGPTPRTSVIQPTGETWETKGLYVADASVFPCASGVNPMVTIMAIASNIADNVISSLDASAKL